ncbi:Uncharacterized protein LHYA1_G002353 [Lachnellula hyalina]|uniref:Conserved oligomeric Golgi complex subunit 1 n=1 Tax=Lachnellula hyalina TaxID=1316788 RepID=A0A8H8R8A3_9HELO|nr:Uncharacterized protein LHYA1_G002353 [Lachnellula hyalina]TVY28624.1 Uncharacterized protein LHYA1_G002353 [Lachnellula hyalina]
MASTILSPTHTLTPSEAFTHPLPQVRTFHRSLTTSLDEKSSHLRTLVGGSYRELLGTAETILRMREDIEVVEEKLGRVGKGCGRNVVGHMVGGLGKLQDEGGAGRDMQLGRAARGKCLGMCGVLASRLLKRNTPAENKALNLVLAAKVLVLGRLLLKSVGGEGEVEEMKRKLGGLRRRLLRGVEKIVQKSGGGDREDLLGALKAYAIATSSGAKDVLRHFLQIRAEALTLAFEDDEDEVPGVVRALELYTRTLLDVQALVPRRLSGALAGLKAKPLLNDEAIRELEGLRLDICERWFGDEILFFTPYIRHDDLEGALAVDTLKGWAKKASEVLLEGLSKSLQTMNEFKAVVALRTRILEIWIKDGGKARGFDPSILLDGLRKVINDRLVQLLETRVKKLHLVATDVEGTLASWRGGITDKQESLWDATMLDMELTHGATLFKQEVLARTHGRNDAISRPLKGYQAWRQLVDEIMTFIEQLKKQRWDDDLEDIEDDITLESRNTLLSKDDPNMLQDHLDTSLEKAYKDLHEKIASMLASYEGEEIGSVSIYILRIIRDFRTELPKNKSLQPFGLALVPQLYDRLASTTSEELIKSYSKSFARKKVVGRSLWEGNPQIPVQPSPATFKLLNGLTLAMAKAGNDLWRPTAVAVLKKHLRTELGRSWFRALKDQEEKAASQTNGATTDGEADSHEAKEESNGVEVVDPVHRKEVLIQSLFDVLLLQSSFELPVAVDDELQKLGGKLEEQVDLESASRKRIQQAAKDYWKRTGGAVPRYRFESGTSQLFFSCSFNNISAMSTTRLTFLYPHLFRSIRVGDPATKSIRTRQQTPTPPRQCSNSRRGFATPSRRAQRFIPRHGKAVEPFLHEDETEEDTKVFTPEENSKEGEKTKDVKQEASEKEAKPPKTENPSSTAPLSEETQAALRLPGDEDVQATGSEKEGGSTPLQQAAANTEDKTAPPLETVLHMPPPETAEQRNAAKPPHLQTPPYVHHFDTYTLVQRVESGGFTNNQSITAMKAVRGLLTTNLDVAKEGLVSKSDVENESYLFRAACSELKTEIQNTRKANEETMRRERSLLQHEVDILNQKLTQEVLRLKDELKGMFDDRKMAVRTEQRAMESAIQELNYKITVGLNSDSKSEVEGLRWVLTRRSVTGILFMAFMVLSSLRYASYKSHEEEVRKKKEAGLKLDESTEDLPPRGAAEILTAN